MRVCAGAFIPLPDFIRKNFAPLEKAFFFFFFPPENSLEPLVSGNVNERDPSPHHASKYSLCANLTERNETLGHVPEHFGGGRLGMKSCYYLRR